jgi:hypothetical protein
MFGTKEPSCRAAAVLDSPLVMLASAEQGGAGRGLLFVNGYLTDGCDHAAWVTTFRRLGWQGSVYTWKWQTGGDYGEYVMGTVLGTAMATEAAAWSLTLVPGIGALVGASRAAQWAWRTARAGAHLLALRSRLTLDWRDRCLLADSEGRRLGAWLGQNRPRWASGELRLAGYSLGARVVYAALDSAGRRGRSIADTVDLYGGALSASCDWNVPLQAVEGAVSNYYSTRDEVLKYFYVVTEQTMPIGLAPLSPTLSCDRRITNHDVTDHILRHSDYETKLGRAAQAVFSRSRRSRRAGDKFPA